MKINKESYIYQHKRRTIFGLSIVLFLLIYFFQNSSFILRVSTTIAFLLFFYFIDRFFDIRFKAVHYALMILIVLATIMFSPFYFVYPNYDKIQHFIVPILLSTVIFYMINKLKLDLKWKITYTFFVTAGILGLFEIGEFLLDWLFDLKLQGVYLRDSAGLEKFNLIQDPLSDTITDLILGYTGAGLYAITQFFRKRKDAFPRK